MDCLEFRRLLGSDPRAMSAAAREHMETWPRCAQAFADAQAFETRIAHALAIDVPEGLADRVLLTQLTEERRRRATGFRYGWIALAAAAALAVVVGVMQRGTAPAHSLPDLVTEHVNGEERVFLNNRTPVDAGEVERAFADRGVRIGSVPAGITYVSECPVGAYRTVHMVMPENDKPVSVVYVVHHRAPAGDEFTRGNLKGREVPIADGTLVLLAEDTSRFDTLEHTWRDALEGRPDIAAGSR